MAETIIDACNRLHKELDNLNGWLYAVLIDNAEQAEAVKEVLENCRNFADCWIPMVEGLIEDFEEEAERQAEERDYEAWLAEALEEDEAEAERQAEQRDYEAWLAETEVERAFGWRD